MFFEPTLGYRGGPLGFVKSVSTLGSPNHLNAFVVRTPYVRDATKEISVLEDEALLSNPNGISTYRGRQTVDPSKHYNTQEIREMIGDHYMQVLQDAMINNEGLLRSNADASLRSEHTLYTYFALPNFNIQNAKHILPYDLRIPVDWSSPNIYKKRGGKLVKYFH